MSSAAIVFLLACTAGAQNAKPPQPQPVAPPEAVNSRDSADKIVENFFALVIKGQVDQAYDNLLNGTKMADSLEYVAQVKVKTKEAINSSGEIQSYELLSIQNVGTHLMRSTYLALGKSFPLRWKFYFYRTDKTWKLIDMRVEIGLSDMFEDSKPQTSGTEQ